MNFFSNKLRNYSDVVEFNVKSLEIGHHKMSYRNVPIIKCPFDYVIYQMIILDVKPDLIVEIGTNKGGSSLYFADLLELTGKGEIHTIDVVDIRDENAKSHNRIKFFSNGFQNYEIKNTHGFQNILIIDDGSHMYEDVKASLEKFNSIINISSYFIVEDGILDQLGWKVNYNGGPNKAIKEFLSKTDSFIIDRKWCDLFGTNATFNTNGYLKRIK